LVFVDKNGNSFPDLGDQFVPRVKLTMDGKVVEASDSRGAFSFRNVSPGRHTIGLDVNSVPIDLIPLVKVLSSIDVAEGTSYILNIPLKVKLPGETGP
jgi:hypothetical protein